MTFDETTKIITRIANLQTELLDHTGHIRRGMSREIASMTTAEINRLRAQIGWREIKPVRHREEAPNG